MHAALLAALTVFGLTLGIAHGSAVLNPPSYPRIEPRWSTTPMQNFSYTPGPDVPCFNNNINFTRPLHTCWGDAFGPVLDTYFAVLIEGGPALGESFTMVTSQKYLGSQGASYLCNYTTQFGIPGYASDIPNDDHTIPSLLQIKTGDDPNDGSFCNLTLPELTSQQQDWAAGLTVTYDGTVYLVKNSFNCHSLLDFQTTGLMRFRCILPKDGYSPPPSEAPSFSPIGQMLDATTIYPA